MINWSLAVICSSPILQNMTDPELSFQIVQNTLEIPYFSRHSQGVERLVKEVLRGSTIVFDEKSRHGLIIPSTTNRKKNFRNWTVNKILLNVLKMQRFTTSDLI